MNKNVIVTGATGFVGRYLLAELLQNGYGVYAVVRNPEKLPKYDNDAQLHIIHKDLEQLTAADFGNTQFDCFFHLGWAGVNRDEIDDEAVHKKNYDIGIKCLEIAGLTGCRCFISIGSKAEYGPECEEQSEETECYPDTAYGREKLRFYKRAYSYCKNAGMVFFHARLFSVIGVYDHPWSLVSTACRNFKNNDSIQLGPCTQKWNFTAVEDVVRGLRLLYEFEGALTNEDNCIYNIAGNDTRVLREFVEEIHSICGSKSEIRYASNQKPNGCMNPVSDKIRQLTGWTEEIAFAESIRRILEQDGC